MIETWLQKDVSLHWSIFGYLWIFVHFYNLFTVFLLLVILNSFRLVEFSHFEYSKSNIIIFQPKFPTKHRIVLRYNSIITPNATILNPMPIFPKWQFKIHWIVYFPNLIWKCTSLWWKVLILLDEFQILWTLKHIT